VENASEKHIRNQKSIHKLECSLDFRQRQETSVTELRPAGQTKGQEGNAQAVEAGTGILRRVEGCCPVA